MDVLTFVLFQAPCSLLPLLVSVALSWEFEIWLAFKARALCHVEMIGKKLLKNVESNSDSENNPPWT